jgi:hypothetical protein
MQVDTYDEKTRGYKSHASVPLYEDLDVIIKDTSNGDTWVVFRDVAE